jgi:phosphatidylglycerophosphatase A
MNRLALWIASCGPLGKLPYAPGTWGSLLGLLIALGLCRTPVLYATSTLLLFVVAVWASDKASHAAKNEDPNWVVIDEVIGVVITFLAIQFTWRTALVGFILFRFFDITKPPPIRFVERAGKGYGIVLDDVLAGIYANLFLQVLTRYAQL